MEPSLPLQLRRALKTPCQAVRAMLRAHVNRAGCALVKGTAMRHKRSLIRISGLDGRAPGRHCRRL
jgi:hypothetical protein